MSGIDSFGISNSLYKKVLELDSTRDYVYSSIWRNIVQKEGNTVEVKERLNKEIESLLAQKGNNISILNSAMWTYRSLGELARVKELEDKILEIDTTGIWAQNILVNRLFQIQDPEERFQACEKFLAENPDSKSKPFIFSFGASLIRNELKWGERWIRECPDDATAYNDLVWYVYQYHEDKLNKALWNILKKQSRLPNPIKKITLWIPWAGFISKRGCTSRRSKQLDFRINGHYKGEEIKIKGKPHIAASIKGTDALKEAEVIRDGSIIKSFDPMKKVYRFKFTDDDFQGKSYYYLRVVQVDKDENGNFSRAWSSPLWVQAVESRK